MTSSKILLVAAALAVGGADVHAQDPDAGQPPGFVRDVGSFTIISQPVGAIVTLEGSQMALTGRAPWTVARGLAGIFEVKGRLDGYEEWTRTVYLDPAADDTLRIRLVPKTRVKAALRSMVIPGWGQMYSGRSGRGALYLIGEIGAGVLWYFLDARYWDRHDDLKRAWKEYAASNQVDEQTVLWQEVERRRARAADADDDRKIAVIALGAIYAANVLDAILFFPKPSPGHLAQGDGVPQLFTSVHGDNLNIGVRLAY